ncbi:MAG: hypothetical protein AAB804_00605 [Patescibacteria group bacterium]
MKKKQERGFIALISTIIMSAVLLLVIASSGLVSFYSRFNTLDSELKQRSDATADACADMALLQLAQDPSYQGGTFTINSLDQCRVGKVAAVGGGNTQFSVQATSSNTAVTNLRVVVDPADLSVVSWQEIAAY